MKWRTNKVLGKVRAMRPLAFAACLLVMPGLASAFEVSIGPNPVIVVTPPPPPLDLGTLPPFTLPEMSVAPVPSFGAVHRMQDAVPGIPVAPNPSSLLLGDTAIVTIEEEGVRLPDEQFSLP
jgi:hypothetical protein